MRGTRSKWIRKVVFSRNPIVLEMIKKEYGEERANKFTYNQVIKICKEMWKRRIPGTEKWEIYEEVKET